MAFTTSDNFDLYAYCALRISSGAVASIRARNTNGDFYYTFGRGEHPTPEIGTQAAHGLGNTSKRYGH